jgi:hypothetical protein
LGSKNCTTLLGVRVAGRLPLRGAGELGIGEECGMRFSVVGAVVRLEIERGVDRGLLVLASPRPVPIGTLGQLSFHQGRPRLFGDRAFRLNGSAAAPRIQLCRGDVVELDGERLEVV